MKKLIALLLCVTLVIAMATVVTAKTPQETFITFLEAEDCKLSGFDAVDKGGAVGKAITSDDKADTFTVDFTLPADGDYRLWLRVWNTGTGDNSLLYNVDGEERVYDFDESADNKDPSFCHYNAWYWREINYRGTEPVVNGLSEWAAANNSVRHTPKILNLKAGANSITFTAREPGAFIDQIIITDNLDYDPSAFEGNTTFICDFSNLTRYVQDIYAAKGITPQQAWTEKLAAEAAPAPTEAADTGAAETMSDTPITAPKTGDTSAVWMVFAALSLAAGFAVIRKKRQLNNT